MRQHRDVVGKNLEPLVRCGRLDTDYFRRLETARYGPRRGDLSGGSLLDRRAHKHESNGDDDRASERDRARPSGCDGGHESKLGCDSKQQSGRRDDEDADHSGTGWA
jgi:hypothetical protein